MKNKILSLVLALLMAASSASAVLADDVVAIAEEEAVVEVAEEVEAGQYDKAIEFLANYGIFKGYDKNNTGAEDLIQRYQMALFVARIATGWTEDEVWEDGPENWSEFSDIDFAPVNSYYGALSFANQNKIIEGYGNGKFGPTDSITYQNALTMVVRTLGYTGLEWPWGYIQKAVELELTHGITGVAYTDELTRGEVAQIIYNALFAKLKGSDTTLALKNFGIEFGWEKVVITASDRNSFEKLEKAPAVDSKFVEFKLLKEDGTLEDDAYLALAEKFGLDTAKHEDDLAVGDAYYVLFEKDADSNRVNVVDAVSLRVDVIENEGKTDNEGEAQEYAIQEFLADYALVPAYTTNEYINATKSGKDELLVWNTIGGTTEDVVNGHAIAIDWETGDILGYEYDKDGKIVDKDGKKDEDGNLVYDKEDYIVQWYYNPLLKRYYKEQFDKKTGEFLGINYMTDAEFEEFYESTATKAAKDFKGFKAITSIADTAYATLEVFDTDLEDDVFADRALYETYKLGYFENSTIKHCDADRASYKISNVGTLANAEVAGKAAEKAVDTTTFHEIVEGACDHGKAFFVEGYTPVVDEDGKYEAGYVIYSADPDTGAIKVVKNINDGSDEDTYVKTGVLRAYNVAKETITIGEDDLTMSYDELAGTGFYYVDKNAATKAAYTGLLRNLFNQFVTYVVVDGELVHIAPKGDTKNEVIVVDSYAGIAKDGAIVVYGYSTSDLEYAEFRIANYNNWYGGDYYYYLDDAKAEASFTKGAIYAISSYDAAEDLYYVQLAGSFVKEDNDETADYIVNSDYVASYNVTITANEDGYTEFTTTDKEHETGVVKMSSDDKYVIITKDAETNPYAPVIVYKGKLAEGWTVTGDRINSNDKDNRTYVIVNATVTGFADTYNTGLALYLKSLNAGFVSAGADEDLLGAYTTEVYAFDVLNGAEKLYTATNKSFKNGTVYFTQDDVLVEDNGVQTMEDLIDNAQDIYGNTTAATTAYGFGYKTVASLDLFDKDNNKDEEFVFEALNGTVFFDVTKFYTDLVDDVTVFTVKYDDDKDVITEVKKVDKDAFKKVIGEASAYNYPAYVVYNTETTDAVVYIDLVYASGITVTDKEATLTNGVKVGEDANAAEAYVEAKVGYIVTKVDDKISSAVVDGIYLTVDGYSVKDATHANVLENNWFFGHEGDCINENVKFDITIGGESVLPVYSCVVEELYKYADGVKCDDDECDLIKSIYIPVAAFDKYDAEGKLVTKDVVVEDAADPVEIVVSINGAEYCSFLFDLYSNKPADFTANTGFVENYKVGNIYASVADKAE